MSKKYIDADKLCEIMQMSIHMIELAIEFYGLNDDEVVQQELKAYKDILNGIKEQPAADVRENVHGAWFGDDDGSVFECNVCGLAWLLNDGTPEENEMNFCPKCGADMRGKES